MPRRPRLPLHLLLIPLAALLAVAPLLRWGCSCGHDFDFHLLSWLEAAGQMAHGVVYPHWADSPAWNAGEPRFVFYPPISWMLGALLTTLLTHLPGVPAATGFGLAPTVYTGLALLGGGLAMYALARRYVPPAAATLAATFYLANPYTLFTAYERTAFAELLAAAWIPLLFRAVLPPSETAVDPGDRAGISMAGVALPVALLWLTNAPAAVMSSYAAALILLVRVGQAWYRTRDGRVCGRLALRALAGMALGLALAAFYIVPAAYEQRWVEIAMAVIPGMRIQDNFLFGHAPPNTPDGAAHDVVLHTASVVACILLLLGAGLIVALASAWRGHRRRRPHPQMLVPLSALMVAIGALLLPVSLPLWRRLPELAFLQFPWRLLALLAPACALALALALERVRSWNRGRRGFGKGDGASDRAEADVGAGDRSGSRARVALAAAAPCVAGLLVWPAYAAFHQTCEAGDLPGARLALFRSGQGVEPTDEYTPGTADNDALREHNPAFRLAPPDDPSGSQAEALQMGAPGNFAAGTRAPRNLDLDPSAAATLILNLRDFPAWQVRLNGSPVVARKERDDGLLAIPLPAGHDHVEVRYLRTPDQEIGDGISAMALPLLLLAAAGPARRRFRDPGRARPLLS